MATRRILFQGGRVVTAGGIADGDVLVVGDKIDSIGNLSDILDPGTVEIVECTGKFVLPGGVDVHTHLDSPMMGTTTADDFASGTLAAAAGGTTTLIDFAMQQPGQALPEALAAHLAKASGRAVIDYGMHMCITDLYADATGDFQEIVRAGVTSFKVFMAYRGTMMLHDGAMFDVFKKAGALGSQVCVHAENGDVIDRIAADMVATGRTGPEFHETSRPPSTETEAVRRAIQVARMADAPIYFVHLSTEGSVEAVSLAKSADWPVFGETCTHYLTLGRELYDAPDFEPAKVVLTPPLRTIEHRTALWRGLRTGSLNVVSSDHCPFCFESQKTLGKDDFRKIPNGGPGVEHRMIVLYAQGVRGDRISLERFVELTATAPAKQFGLFPRKGHLAPGSDADVVLLDPAGTTTITAETQNQRIDYTPWEGWQLPGRIDKVYSRGDLVAVAGRYVGASGRGEFLHRREV